MIKLAKVALVFDRKKTATTSKPASIEIRVSHNYKQKYISTGIKILPKQWDKKNSMIRNHEDAELLNKSLNEQRQAVINAVQAMKDDVRLELLSESTKGREKAAECLWAYIARRIEDRNIRESTRKRYRSWFNTFKEYGKIKDWKDISKSSVIAYGEWVAKRDGITGNFTQGTVYGHNAALKSFLTDAVADGIIDSNPYITGRVKIGRGNKRHADTLTPEQVSTLEKLDLHLTPSIERTRDIFLFQCYTGLSYSDLQEFNSEKITKTDGVKIYRGQRKKTGVEFFFVIIDKAEGILKRYNYSLPVPSNQKYNQFLKVLGLMIGVNNLHSHTGRASCATIMRNAGVSLSVIQLALGHSLAAQTEHYASLMEETAIQEMEKLKKK